MAPVTRSQRKELLTIIRERKRSIGRSIGNAIQGSRWTHKLEEVGKCEIIFCVLFVCIVLIQMDDSQYYFIFS